MDSDFSLGDRFFKSKDSGFKLPGIVKGKTIRWSSASASNVALIDLGYASATLNPPIGTNDSFVNVIYLVLSAYFTDLSPSAQYRVSDRCVIVPQSIIGNGDKDVFPAFPSFSITTPLNLMMQVVNGTLDFNVTITGADVKVFTGITPAAGDSMNYDLSVCYSV